MDSVSTISIHVAQAAKEYILWMPRDIFNTFLSVFVAMIISLALQYYETRKGLKQLKEDRELRDIESKLIDLKYLLDNINVIKKDMIYNEPGWKNWFIELEFRLPLELRESFNYESIRKMNEDNRIKYFDNFIESLRKDTQELYKRRNKLIYGE